MGTVAGVNSLASCLVAGSSTHFEKDNFFEAMDTLEYRPIMTSILPGASLDGVSLALLMVTAAGREAILTKS